MATISVRDGTRLTDAAAIAAVTVWGIGPVLIKFWIGAAVFTAALYARGQRLTAAVIRQSVVGGVVFALNLITFFTAVKLTTVTDASVITALQPALLLFVASRRV